MNKLIKIQLRYYFSKINFQDSQNSKVLIEKLLNRLSDLPTSDCRPAVAVTGLKRSATELHDFKTTYKRNDQENSSPKYQGLSSGTNDNAANLTKAHVIDGRASANTATAKSRSLDEMMYGGVVGDGRRAKSSDSIVRESCKRIMDGDKAAATTASQRYEKRKIG